MLNTCVCVCVLFVTFRFRLSTRGLIVLFFILGFYLVFGIFRIDFVLVLLG